MATLPSRLVAVVLVKGLAHFLFFNLYRAIHLCENRIASYSMQGSHGSLIPEQTGSHSTQFRQWTGLIDWLAESVFGWSSGTSWVA